MTGSGMRRVFSASAAAVFAAAVFVAGVFLAASVGKAQSTAALPTAATAQRPQVIDLRFGRHPDKTRIVIELSERTGFQVEAALDPPRVVVSFTDLAPGGRALVEGPGVDLIARYRQETDGGLRRMVFSGAAPLRVKEAFMIPPRDGRQSRLVVDVEAGLPPATIRSAAAVPPPPPAVGKPPPADGGKPLPADGVKPLTVAVAQPPGLPAQKPRPVAPIKTPLIVIDPGHGGADPGAIGVGGVHEKDVTLAAARELRRQLQAGGRYRVKLTRDSDIFVRLRDRVSMAREAEADLFISLHADAIGSDQVRGLSIYTLSGKASDREAETLAAKENRADAIVGMDLSAEHPLVASILIDLAQRDTRNHSKRFASAALRNLSREVRVLTGKPQREAGFAVLTAPDVPSVLVEMGYLSNSADVQLLSSDAFRRNLARDLTRAVDSYFSGAATAKR